MAKKRKSKPTSKKSKAKKSNKSAKGKEKDIKKQPKGVPEGFWRQVASLSLILFAVLMLFGSIDKGGTLPMAIHDWSRWVIGYVAYALPFLLILVGFIKIRSEDHKLQRSIFWGLVIMMFAAGGFAHLFVAEGMSLDAVDAGEGGGMIGHVAYSLIIGPLSKVTGGIVLFFISVIALHFVFRLPLNHLLKMLKITKPERTSVADGETDSAEKVADIKPSKFKINTGVPIEPIKTKLNIATPSALKKEKQALTLVSNPNWNFPSLELLAKDAAGAGKSDQAELEEKANIIAETLKRFGLEVAVTGANPGPRITQFMLTPAPDVQINNVYKYQNNLKLQLAAESINIQAPIPGTSSIGVEVPNKSPQLVRMQTAMQHMSWTKSKSPLSFIVGKDVTGRVKVDDLDEMPHMLVAGATKAGKSVMLHSMLISLLYRNAPSDLKLIIVDPKHGVEMGAYSDIPHLLTPIISESDKCLSALKWSVNEMERRYKVLREAEVRNIQEYNEKHKEEGMPFIVIVIDELADFMQDTQIKGELEKNISRIAAKARAVGLHLVLATQSPKKEIITGLIKANIDARIAFRTTGQVPSRVILDVNGAEKLLGNGDMLFKTPSEANLIRLQGIYVSNEEVQAVTDFIRMEGQPDYNDDVVSQPVDTGGSGVGGGVADSKDALYEEAVEMVINQGQASTSMLITRFSIGYNRAKRLIYMMEQKGIIGKARGAKPREVLVSSLSEALDEAPEDDYEPEPYEENF